MFSPIKFFCCALLLTTSAWAQESESDYDGYDSIVDELKSSTNTPLPKSEDPFDLIVIHGGVGLVTSYLSIRPTEGPEISGFQKGFEARLGVDLFSPYWMAEGGLRNFSSTQIENNTHASLNEFNLRLLYRNPMSRQVKLRIGGGVAARYLEVKSRAAGAIRKQEYSTPASILSLGLEAALARNVSVGAEVSYRSALITDTADKGAADACFNLGFHF